MTLFGTNQSMLEALLLKRKVMGPSWLALQKPVRVATQSQVQLCTKASHSSSKCSWWSSPVALQNMRQPE